MINKKSPRGIWIHHCSPSLQGANILLATRHTNPSLLVTKEATNICLAERKPGVWGKWPPTKEKFKKRELLVKTPSWRRGNKKGKFKFGPKKWPKGERGWGYANPSTPLLNLPLGLRHVVHSHSGLISQLGSSLKMTAGIIDLNAKIQSDDVLLGTVRSPSELVF